MQNHAQSSCLKIKLPESGGHKWDTLDPFNHSFLNPDLIAKTKCIVCGSILEVKLKISIYNGGESDIEMKIKYLFQSSGSGYWDLNPEEIEDCNQITMQKALK